LSSRGLLTSFLLSVLQTFDVVSEIKERKEVVSAHLGSLLLLIATAAPGQKRFPSAQGCESQLRAFEELLASWSERSHELQTISLFCALLVTQGQQEIKNERLKNGYLKGKTISLQRSDLL